MKDGNVVMIFPDYVSHRKGLYLFRPHSRHINVLIIYYCLILVVGKDRTNRNVNVGLTFTLQIPIQNYLLE